MLLLRRKSLPPQSVEAPKATKTIHAIRAPLAGSVADNFSRTAKAKQQIEVQLKLISKAYDAIDTAQEIVDTACKVLEAQLRLVNLKSHSDGVYVASLEEVWSRQSRVIDPKKFRAQVDAEVFWGAIKINIDQAKDHLSEKELARISDVTPGALTGIKLKVAKEKPAKRE